MLTFLTVLHLVNACVLIFFVLIQDAKGGGAMGVFGGGSSQSLLGSTGASNFFTQVTKGAAILFALLCITMTYIISHPSKSVLDKAGPGATTPVDSPIPIDSPVQDAKSAVPPAAEPQAPAQQPAETK